MSDLPTDSNTNRTVQARSNSRAQSVSNSALNREPKSKRLKYYWNRNLHKAGIWIEAACALVLVGITGTYIRFAGGQLDEMRKATNATQTAAEAAKGSSDLTRKQMESVDAAKVDLPRGVYISFPFPPRGEAIANLINSGHAAAHDVHLSLTVTLNESNEQRLNARGRKILYKTETIPAIRPSNAIAREDFVYPFELSQEQYKRILKTDDYIIAEGVVDYENGFNTRIKQPFCYAYIWGSPNFGRWQGPCDQAKTKIREAKR